MNRGILVPPASVPVAFIDRGHTLSVKAALVKGNVTTEFVEDNPPDASLSNLGVEVPAAWKPRKSPVDTLIVNPVTCCALPAVIVPPASESLDE